MGSDEINDHVVPEAARRLGESTLLKYNEFRVVMCERCTSTLVVKGRHDATNLKGADGIGIPTKCSCGGDYKVLDPTVAKLSGLLTDYAEIKREDQVEVGDIVEPLTWGFGGGWNRQLVLEVDREKNRVRYARAYVRSFFQLSHADLYPRCEDYWCAWSEDERSVGWVKYWRDSTTVYHYLEDRRKFVNRDQLVVYWFRLHFAIERDCPDPADNEHQLRYDCMVIEQDVIRAGSPIPEIPSKEQIKAGVVV